MVQRQFRNPIVNKLIILVLNLLGTDIKLHELKLL